MCEHDAAMHCSSRGAGELFGSCSVYRDASARRRQGSFRRVDLTPEVEAVEGVCVEERYANSEHCIVFLLLLYSYLHYLHLNCCDAEEEALNTKLGIVLRRLEKAMKALTTAGGNDIFGDFTTSGGTQRIEASRKVKKFK